MSSPLIVRDDIPTAATDMKSIFYNPAFFNTLDVEQIMFVLAHEVMHIALAHGARLNGRNMQLWNVACDYSINHILTETGFKFIQGCLFDPQYGVNSADVNYELLKKKFPKSQAGGAGPNSGSLGSDVLPMGGDDPDETAKIERSIQQRVAQAASMARMAGNMPGALEKFINEVLNPVVPWQALLREYMTRITPADESWSKRNRRFSDVYLPARKSEQMGEIVIIGDTSGSITQDDFNRIGAEVSAIADSVKPERIRVIWADTDVAGEQVFEMGEPLDLKPMGGGGTDMRVPLTHAEQYEPVVTVLITDGYTPWPDGEPPYPLVVVCTTDTAVPVGQVVRV